MTAQGVGNACRIDGHMNVELYTSILGNEFIKPTSTTSWTQARSSTNRATIPSTPHYSTRKWLEDKEIKVLERFTQTPGLNSIEH